MIDAIIIIVHVQIMTFIQLKIHKPYYRIVNFRSLRIDILFFTVATPLRINHSSYY